MIRLFKPYLLICLLFVASANCKKPDNGSITVTPPPVTKDTTFTNPLLSSGPDPWVIQKDSFYYYTNTSGDRLKLWRTTAMSKLKDAYVQTIWTKPSTGPNSQNVWAPELHYLDGKWYMYYAAGASSDQSTQRIFVFENISADPLSGSWTDKGKVADPSADYFAIDATIFENNGKRYLIWSGHANAVDNTQCLYIAQMSNPWTLSTGRSLISSPQYPWEMIGSSPVSSLPQVNEGPEILKGPTGKSFLIYSASGCWTDDYALGMLTLKDNGDPMNAADWVKNPNPVFVKRPEAGAYGPGHNAFFKSPDKTEDWIIYHANPAPNQQCGDTRSPRMQKFTWNADGTPNFGQPVQINTPIPHPSGEKS
jgi:GH43 family beta-xylosidase